MCSPPCNIPQFDGNSYWNFFRKIAAGTLRFSRYLRCGVLVVWARKLTIPLSNFYFCLHPCWEGLFYGDGCPGQFVVTLRMMISDILVSPIPQTKIKSTNLCLPPFPLWTVLPNPHDFRICEGSCGHHPRRTSRSCKTWNHGQFCFRWYLHISCIWLRFW